MAGIQGMGTPKSLQPPIPGEEDQSQLLQKAISVDLPQADLSQPPRVSSSAPIDDMEADFAGIVGDQAVVDEMNSDFNSMFGEEPTSLDTLSLGEQFQQIPTRARASFARSDKEVKQVLEDAYGKENVRIKGDKLEYKNNNKWNEFDKGNELIGDVVDFTRDAVEEIPATLATAAAIPFAAAETLGSGGVGGLAAPAIIGGARAAGAVAGQGLGDLMQNILGIKRDEDRSAALEYGLTAALSPITGFLGDVAVKKLEQRAAQKATQKLMSPRQVYKEEINNITDTTKELMDQGLLENIPGTNTPLLLSQINPSNPLAAEITKKASGLPEFAQTIELQAQSFDKSLNSFLSTLGQASENIGSKFKNFVKSATEQEGKLISSVRKDLIESSGNAELPVPNLLNKVDAFRKELGFVKGLDGNYPTSKEVAKQLIDNGFDRSGAQIVARKAEKVFEEITNKEGRLTAPELLGFYEELNGVYRNVVDKGINTNQGFKRKIGELRRYVADELIDKVGVISNGDTQKGYVKNLARYKELVESGDELAGVLANNQVNSNALAKAIFDKGKDGLDSLNAAKVLLRDQPELMNDVVGQYFQNIKAIPGVYNQATKRTNWNKFLGEIDKLGPEMLESAFGPEPKKTLNSFKVVSEAIESGNIPFGQTANKANFLKNLALAASSPFAAGSAALSQISGLAGAEALVEATTKEGIDNFLKLAPKDSKPVLKSFLEGLQKSALAVAEKNQRFQVAPVLTREALRSRKENAVSK